MQKYITDDAIVCCGRNGKYARIARYFCIGNFFSESIVRFGGHELIGRRYIGGLYQGVRFSKRFNFLMICVQNE